MPRFLPASACTIGAKVLPEYGVARHRLERDTSGELTVLLLHAVIITLGAGWVWDRTLDPATPRLVWPIPPHLGDFCATLLDFISPHPGH